jgi:hypothetical protein
MLWLHDSSLPRCTALSQTTEKTWVSKHPWTSTLGPLSCCPGVRWAVQHLPLWRCARNCPNKTKWSILHHSWWHLPTLTLNFHLQHSSVDMEFMTLDLSPSFFVLFSLYFSKVHDYHSCLCLHNIYSTQNSESIITYLCRLRAVCDPRPSVLPLYSLFPSKASPPMAPTASPPLGFSNTALFGGHLLPWF